MNRVELEGRLVRPPEYQKTAHGTPLLNFTVVVDSTPRYDKEKDAHVSFPNFISVNVWGDLGQFLSTQRLEKGEMIYVLGELDQSSWEDKDGNKQSKTRVKAHLVQSMQRPFPRGMGAQGAEDLEDAASSAPF